MTPAHPSRVWQELEHRSNACARFLSSPRPEGSQARAGR